MTYREGHNEINFGGDEFGSHVQEAHNQLITRKPPTKLGLFQAHFGQRFTMIKWWTLLTSADGVGTRILTAAPYEKNEMSSAAKDTTSMQVASILPVPEITVYF